MTNSLFRYIAISLPYRKEAGWNGNDDCRIHFRSWLKKAELNKAGPGMAISGNLYFGASQPSGDYVSTTPLTVTVNYN